MSTLLLGMGACAASLAAQNPTILSSRVTLVRVDVAVTRGGRAVQGLTAKDFELLDNGVPQVVAMVDAGETPLSVCLVFDVSSSVAGEKLAHLVEAASGFIDGLRPQDQAALLTFSHDLRLLTPTTASPRDVRAALMQLRPEGATSLFDAFSAALLLPVPYDRRAVVMIFSDGQDTMSWLTPDAAANLAQRSIAVAYTVALRERATPQRLLGGPSESPTLRILRRLSEATGGSVALADSSRELKALFLQALLDIRERYLLAYYPEGVAAEGWHTIEVRLRAKRGDIRFRPGYFAAHP